MGKQHTYICHNSAMIHSIQYTVEDKYIQHFCTQFIFVSVKEYTVNLSKRVTM